MLKAARVGVVLLAMTTVAAGCGSSSSAPDVSGSPASDSATLFKASNLDKVLSQVSSKLGSTQLTALKIEPRDVKAVGQNRTVTVDYNGNSVVINTPPIPAITAFLIGAVQPSAVEKAVSAVESKAKLAQSDISYVAVTKLPTTNAPILLIYLRTSSDHYQASITGSHVTKNGFGAVGSVPSPSGALPSGAGSGGAGAAPSGSGGSGGASATAIAECVAKAGGDPAKIKACVGQ